MIPLRDTVRSRHFPLVTWLILGANTIVFLFQLALDNNSLDHFVKSFALIPANWKTDPAWFILTLFTHMFMHAGWFHFLSNMWIFYIFADNVEDRMGPFGFLSFYVSSGLAAALLQTFVNPNSIIPTLGASGAIAGVMGAYILLYPRARVVTLIPIFFVFTTFNIPAIFYLGFWFVSQLFSGLSSLGTTMGGVAWWAHVGGFMYGLVISRFFMWRPKPLPEPWSPYQIIDVNHDEPGW